MASSSQVRRWWAAWECDTERYVKMPFPRSTGTVQLWVADASAPVWAAVGQIMATVPYYFTEGAGGTYNCRNIGVDWHQEHPRLCARLGFEPVEESAQVTRSRLICRRASSPGWKGSEPPGYRLCSGVAGGTGLMRCTGR